MILTEPLRALGTEPFWAVNIDGDGLVYSGVDRPEERAPNAGPQMAGTTAMWSGQTDQGRVLSVTLIETPCSDGMSDRTLSPDSPGRDRRGGAERLRRLGGLPDEYGRTGRAAGVSGGFAHRCLPRNRPN
ncbi:hypothetical protein [Brevundimonas denitrificans]|uniref:hypothetical protein n=1 Tax=Brevundimonas denitrificans TaxID=1443434 RepID=UPI00223B2471|nr:hypothetical protein [Brevundimonas denitrificans]